MILNSIKIFFYCILLIFTFSKSYCQTGGTHTYDFLNLTNSARVAALGGKNVSLNDSDLNLTFHDPALLNPSMDKNLVLNYVSYYAQINYGYASYAFSRGNNNSFAIGIHYINYGTFDAADPTGVITGKFTAAEYALNLIFARSIDSSFRWGVNVKPIYSSLERYRSIGLAIDGGITYTSSDRLTTIAGVFRNLGSQITSYTGNYEPLPFEILLGITRKLEHAPLRFSFTAQNLQMYKLAYEDTLVSNSNKSKFDNFTDNLFRHIIVGAEFLPSKSFYVSFAYNYERRQEMALQGDQGMLDFHMG